MMDGRIGAIREFLDNCAFSNVCILSYAAKFCSCLYKPFREVVGSRTMSQSVDKSTYQMDVANSREALLEARLDVDEGADIIMIKPGMFYLDVIAAASATFEVPVFAYQVGGEYAMIKAASANGWLDYSQCMYEALISMRRAGARAPVLLGEFVALCRKYIEDLALHTLHKETCIIIGSVEQKDAQPCEVIYLLSNGTVQTLMHIPKYLCDTQSCTTFRVNGLEAALLIEGNSEDVTISSGVDLLILMGQSIHGWPDVLSYCMKLSGKFGAQLAYVNLLGGYESQVFPGGSLVCDDAKVCLCALWSEEQNVMHPHVARNDIGEPPISEERDYQNLMLALRDYTHKNGFAGVTLGMSGGIDSALVAAIAADALGPQYVHTFMLRQDILLLQV
ncbi:hypothetical protein GH714_042612 [Hevea brasiliensis]|uniref:Delta-aminolevulinic acid dehydratase n=1 Tax=Hevea brasiliensis TaxID=3981 RepID=A0A6A6K0Y1_HEVBR|nr:hypothetical protein GH714_042612 [Hevea brasiliensis]